MKGEVFRFCVPTVHRDRFFGHFAGPGSTVSRNAGSSAGAWEQIMTFSLVGL